MTSGVTRLAKPKLRAARCQMESMEVLGQSLPTNPLAVETEVQSLAQVRRAVQ